MTSEQLDQLENMNFDKALPGGSSGKPDKDELEMMQDIMGGEMVSDEDGDITNVSKRTSHKSSKMKAASKAQVKSVSPHTD